MDTSAKINQDLRNATVERKKSLDIVAWDSNEMRTMPLW